MNISLNENKLLNGHNQRITSITVPEDSPDTFYTSSRDKKILQWKLTNSESFALVMKSYEDSTHFVNTIAVTRGDKLIGGGSDSLGRIYDINSKDMVKMVGHTRDITCVCINSSDTKIVTGSMDASIALWNTLGEMIVKFGRQHKNGHQDWVTCCSFIPGKDFIVSGCSDGSLKVWDMLSGDVISTFYKGSLKKIPECGGVTCLGITPDGTYVAYASRDSEVYIIHLERGECIRTHKTESVVYACSFALNEPVLALASKDQITLWDVLNNKILTQKNISEFEKNSFFTSVAWCRNSLLAGLDNGKIMVFDYNKEIVENH